MMPNSATNKPFKRHTFTPLSLALSLCMMSAFADDSVDLGTLTVSTTQTKGASNLLNSSNISNQTIHGSTLKTKAVTLGDALSGELGIHSNQFGGGASAPIIRGQEGKRITILQNSADVIDMAHLSPDHAVMVDTVLARQAEIVRGLALYFTSLAI